MLLGGASNLTLVEDEGRAIVVVVEEMYFVRCGCGEYCYVE